MAVNLTGATPDSAADQKLAALAAAQTVSTKNSGKMTRWAKLAVLRLCSTCEFLLSGRRSPVARPKASPSCPTRSSDPQG